MTLLEFFFCIFNFIIQFCHLLGWRVKCQRKHCALLFRFIFMFFWSCFAGCAAADSLYATTFFRVRCSSTMTRWWWIAQQSTRRNNHKKLMYGERTTEDGALLAGLCGAQEVYDDEEERVEKWGKMKMLAIEWKSELKELVQSVKSDSLVTLEHWFTVSKSCLLKTPRQVQAVSWIVEWAHDFGSCLHHVCCLTPVHDENVFFKRFFSGRFTSENWL